MSENKGGRPLKFSSVEELQTKIDEYFYLCKDKGDKPLITGLALHLDTSRETLCNYEEKEEFFDTIKRAKLKCELELEKNLVEGKVNPTGSIFNLKNNYGWKDQTHTDLTSGDKPIPLLSINALLPNDSDKQDTPTPEEN